MITRSVPPAQADSDSRFRIKVRQARSSIHNLSLGGPSVIDMDQVVTDLFRHNFQHGAA
jgi:hypothetical protein